MKYCLKDKELQKKLDNISRGEFSQKLNEGAKLNGILGVFEVRFHICGCYVEEHREYNPKSWNDFPAVTPPEGVLMATEFYWSQKDFEEECPCRSCWMFKNGKWHWMDGRDCLVDYGWKNIRFRPWEE